MVFSFMLLFLKVVDLDAFRYYSENGTSTILAPVAAGTINGIIYGFAMKLNGSIGYKVKGPNGNCIYLPAAAYHSSPYSTILRGYVCYWSSSLNMDNCNQAYCLHDFIGTVNVEGVLEPYCKDRCLGYTVRAVAE